MTQINLKKPKPIIDTMAGFTDQHQMSASPVPEGVNAFEHYFQPNKLPDDAPWYVQGAEALRRVVNLPVNISDEAKKKIREIGLRLFSGGLPVNTQNKKQMWMERQ